MKLINTLIYTFWSFPLMAALTLFAAFVHFVTFNWGFFSEAVDILDELVIDLEKSWRDLFGKL